MIYNMIWYDITKSYIILKIILVLSFFHASMRVPYTFPWRVIENFIFPWFVILGKNLFYIHVNSNFDFFMNVKSCFEFPVMREKAK